MDHIAQFIGANSQGALVKVFEQRRSLAFTIQTEVNVGPWWHWEVIPTPAEALPGVRVGPTLAPLPGPLNANHVLLPLAFPLEHPALVHLGAVVLLASGVNAGLLVADCTTGVLGDVFLSADRADSGKVQDLPPTHAIDLVLLGPCQRATSRCRPLWPRSRGW